MVATGWDTVMVIAQAMQKAGTTDGAAVAKAMEGTHYDLSDRQAHMVECSDRP